MFNNSLNFRIRIQDLVDNLIKIVKYLRFGGQRGINSLYFHYSLLNIINPTVDLFYFLNNYIIVTN